MPYNNVKLVTPYFNVLLVTPNNNVKLVTPYNNVKLVTPYYNVMLVTPYNNVKLVTPYYNVLICVTLSRASLLPITVLSQDSHVYRIAIEEEGGGGESVFREVGRRVGI